jgi:hypothetical protein
MKPIDYSQTIMYKLVSKDLNSDLIYVGHTTNFTNRKYAHKSDCNNIKKNNLKLYQMINANGGWDKWQMIQIEEFCCQNRREADKRERELMEEFNANLNKARPIITEEERVVNKKEYYEKNKDAIQVKQQEYNEKNRDAIATYKQEWAEKNKDKCIASKTKYYEKNRDICIARTKEWRLQKRLNKSNSV